MTYRIHIPRAVEGDEATSVLHGSVFSVRLNGRLLSRDEYELSCDHPHDTAGCPACLERSAGLALGEDLRNLSRGVGMDPPRGTWGLGQADEAEP